jgi:hypothetical protein
MPPTATPEDIKAYQDRVEKDEIKPHSLPPCPLCHSESGVFKIHAYRERRFLIIVEMIVRSVCSILVRFKCPCGKTFTLYPDFALPRKHYTRQTITGLAERYVAFSESTYENTVAVEEEGGGVPEYPDGRSLAPSTVHRFITGLSRLRETARKALDLIRQEDPATSVCRDLASLSVSASKYRSAARLDSLLGCFRLLVAEGFFKTVFGISIFTGLAKATGFT